MNKATIRDINLKNKTVIVRVDFNVPIENGKITDDLRIRESLPTIKYLLENNCKVVLMSHLGRPKGKVAKEFGMNPVAERLSALLNKLVLKLDDCIGHEVEQKVKQAKSGDIILLENLRFHPEEEENNLDFAKKLASLGEIYVNDAFGTAHRAHASTEGVTNFLPAVAGFLMEKELNYLGEVLENPEHPFIALLGGAKVSDKIEVIKNLLNKVDGILIGGGMAFTFLKAKGLNVGKSILDEKIELASQLIDLAKSKGVRFELPSDIVVTESLGENKPYNIVAVDKIPEDKMGVDIGPETVKKFSEILKTAKLVFWNGPLGVFERDEFAKGTEQIAKTLADSKAKSIVGGGDSASCLQKLGLASKITHISTGGGASLEFLEGKPLPGVAALLDKNKIPSIH